MSTSPVRCGIVGFGLIAERAHLAALQACGVEVRAIVEVHPERRLAARRLLPKAVLYDTLEALLRAGGIDFVDVCTPPHLHFEALERCLDAGVPVLCEKPLVTTRREGDALAARAERGAVPVGCMHNWVYAPIFVEARAWVRAGRIGSLRDVSVRTERTQPAGSAADAANWRIDGARAGGGILFDHGWHGMSILLRQAAAAPVTVSGTVLCSPRCNLAVEDTADADIRFADGLRGRFFATWAGTARRNEALWRGDAGEIRLHDDTLELWQEGRRHQCQVFAESLAGGGYRAGWMAPVIADFLAEVRGDTRPGAMLSEALASLHLILATYASAAAEGAPTPIG